MTDFTSLAAQAAAALAQGQETVVVDATTVLALCELYEGLAEALNNIDRAIDDLGMWGEDE